MNPVPVFAFAGFSGSGKTTLIVRLLPELQAAGMRVATLKHHGHAGPIDVARKDTARHLAAGAERCILLSPMGTLDVSRTPLSPHQAIERLEEDYDLVLAEGFKHGPFPTFWVG